MMTESTIGIITPTIGGPHLAACLRSVMEQTIPVVHYLVIDGAQYHQEVMDIVESLPSQTHLRIIFLEENVGKGFYGHRVYSSVPALCNTDFIIYLDSDNTLQPHHCASLLSTLHRTQAQWAYSLRNIVDVKGTWLCCDNCESLGKWNAYSPDPAHIYQHIDTSCYCVPRSLAITVGPAWYGQWGADRVFFSHLRKIAPRFACTGEYTVNYRLGGNAGSVQLPFFLAGNAEYAQRFNQSFPWRQKENHSHV
jgi:glycosyltransferase involved in cell wall biosynthesis